jgi:hypothetical protein
MEEKAALEKYIKVTSSDKENGENFFKKEKNKLRSKKQAETIEEPMGKKQRVEEGNKSAMKGTDNENNNKFSNEERDGNENNNRRVELKMEKKSGGKKVRNTKKGKGRGTIKKKINRLENKEKKNDNEGEVGLRDESTDRDEKNGSNDDLIAGDVERAGVDVEDATRVQMDDEVEEEPEEEKGSDNDDWRLLYQGDVFEGANDTDEEEDSGDDEGYDNQEGSDDNDGGNTKTRISRIGKL